MTSLGLTRLGCALAGVLLCTVLTPAQSGTVPLRTAPTEKFTVTAGFRDWGPTTVAGTTIVGGNSTNRGGLFAVDMVTGKMKWTSRPTGTPNGSPGVSTAPAVSGSIILAPMGNTLVALSLATGKELWRGPATAQSAAVVASAGLAYVTGEDHAFRALDAATGREQWKFAFARGHGSCNSEPIVRDGVVYVTGSVLVTAADANNPNRYSRHLFALDAATGKERWRYPSSGTSGVCFRNPVLTTDTFYGTSAVTLYAVTIATGRDRFQPVETRATVEGRVRSVPLFALVDAGSVLIGLTRDTLMAIDKASGATEWAIGGQYHENSPSLAVAGNVLYFQGHPGVSSAPENPNAYVGGKRVMSTPALPTRVLHALDLDTRAVLWSFSRPTEEANWSFGFVTPVDGGLWVDSYKVLVKLQ